MERLFIITAVFLGIFGCMASSLSTVDLDSTPSADRPADAGRLMVERERANDVRPRAAAVSGNALTLYRRSDGHFYADVEINGASIEMLVDTGASGIALSENDARRAGIATSIGMRDEVGQGAGGTVFGDVVQIERVRLGDIEVEGVNGVVLKGGDMSLLGQSFLSKFGKVEIEGDRMILRA